MRPHNTAPTQGATTRPSPRIEFQACFERPWKRYVQNYLHMCVYTAHLIALPLSIVSAFYEISDGIIATGASSSRPRTASPPQFGRAALSLPLGMPGSPVSPRSGVFSGSSIRKAHKAPGQVDREQHRL